MKIICNFWCKNPFIRFIGSTKHAHTDTRAVSIARSERRYQLSRVGRPQDLALSLSPSVFVSGSSESTRPALIGSYGASGVLRYCPERSGAAQLHVEVPPRSALARALVFCFFFFSVTLRRFALDLDSTLQGFSVSLHHPRSPSCVLSPSSAVRLPRTYPTTDQRLLPYSSLRFLISLSLPRAYSFHLPFESRLSGPVHRALRLSATCVYTGEATQATET